ncbi:MAG: ATP-binding cassette domain-containing protein [Muribaculaceae bacterium]|nr:ATP-binding cassette domain-containing protein [Muribaculaceae bacterium]
MGNILEAENIVKHYTGHTALDNVSITVPRGSVYGLLGPNGAGKTTFIRIINHITAPDSGRVIFDGHPLTADDVASIGYLPEERGLYKKMKVGEQAVFFAMLKGLSRREATIKLKEWFDRFEIGDWWNKKVEELSKGMAQKVQFIITVLHEPKLLIFDEPFSGFDPINAEMLKNEILHLRDQGATIIFSTHNMGSVEEICDHITLINRSRNILSGSVADVKAKYSLGRYDITVDQSDERLRQALSPLVADLIESRISSERVTLSVKLAENACVRDLIAAANSNANICGFSESVPSINDIFISAVKNSDQN